MAPLNVRLPPARDSMGNVAAPPPTDIADVDVFGTHGDAFTVSLGNSSYVVSPNAARCAFRLAIGMP